MNKTEQTIKQSLDAAKKDYKIKNRIIKIISGKKGMLGDFDILGVCFDRCTSKIFTLFVYKKSSCEVQMHTYKVNCGMNGYSLKLFDSTPISKKLFETMLYPKVSDGFEPSKLLLDYCSENGKPLIFNRSR